VRRDRQTGGILAFLADRFNVRSREELATEALRYLLQEYPEVRDAMVDALSTTLIAPDTRSNIAFMSQARSAYDPWVVDVEGRVNEHVYISIEGKLDASLQPSQPVDYVKRLEAGGSLLFVCPSRRIARLRPELERRAAREGLLTKNAVWTQDAADITWIPLIAAKQLGITSWISLLRLAGDIGGDTSQGLQSDLDQLERLVAMYELELEAWTAGELRDGGVGTTFAKALLSTRVLCGIISAQMHISIRPSWTTTTSHVRNSGDFWDWYGGKVSLPEPAGGLLAISFDPLLWGQDHASSPIRLSFLVRGLSGETIEALHPVYLQMLKRANSQLEQKVGAGSANTCDRSEEWWIVPFPIRPELAGEEAREDMTQTAADVLRPLLDLIMPSA
jgi:hypothetical protein